MSEEPLNVEPMPLDLSDKLRLRLAELEQEEKAAWAHLNAVCGAAGEIRNILAELNNVQPQ